MIWTLLCLLLVTLHLSITPALKSRPVPAQHVSGFLQMESRTSGISVESRSSHIIHGSDASEAAVWNVKEVPTFQKTLAAFTRTSCFTVTLIVVCIIMVDALILAVWMYKSRKEEIVDFEYEDQRYYGRLCEIITELAGMLNASAKVSRLDQQIFIAVIPREHLQNQQGAKKKFEAWRSGSVAWWNDEADFDGGLEAVDQLPFTAISNVVVKKNSVRMKERCEKGCKRSTDVVFSSAKNAEVWGSTLAALIEQFSEDFEARPSNTQ